MQVSDRLVCLKRHKCISTLLCTYTFGSYSQMDLGYGTSAFAHYLNVMRGNTNLEV